MFCTLAWGPPRPEWKSKLTRIYPNYSISIMFVYVTMSCLMLGQMITKADYA
jgi:hypothetical protein